tara:strand:+ start:85 stop:414 length:330 start_codon:yes stop_codon:yes gene_type:complete
MLKSGEDIIADVKEIKSNEDVIGYYFNDPLIVKMYEPEEPTVLSEGTTNQYSSKINIVFYPWVPLSAEKRVPCSADWVITIVEPIENLKKLYQEKLDGRQDSQNPVVIN